MLHPKQILAWIVKKWGYEYLLVAGGALLGLLIVVIVGFDGQSVPKPTAPPTAAPQRSSSPTKAPKPLEPNKAPIKAAKKIEAESRQIVSKPVPAPIAQPPEKDTPAWQRFAAVHGPTLGRPMIAVMIDDMGIDRKRSARAIRLPGPLTMSFLTYVRSVKDQASAARAAGHEIMIHVPMEADDTSAYAGPKTLKRNLSKIELKRRVDWALGRLDDYVGINNHMGSRFTAHDAGMSLILSEVKRRGLLFVDSRTSPRSVGQQVARELSVPFAARDIFLDDDPSRKAVMRQLTALEQIASGRGYAIAIGHPYDSTLSLLDKWLPTLAARGFVLVPVSAIVRHIGKAG